MRRVYDIFSADGKLLVANLTGGDREFASTQRPAEAWLADSQTWLFAQLQPDISVPTATDALIALHLDGGFCNSPRKGKFEKLFRITMRFLGYLTEVTIHTGFGELIIVHQGFDECALLSSCLKLRNLGWV